MPPLLGVCVTAVIALALSGDGHGQDQGQRQGQGQGQSSQTGDQHRDLVGDVAQDGPAGPGADPDGPETDSRGGSAGVLRIAPVEPVMRDGFRMEGAAEIERVFGDSEQLKKSLDRFYATIATMDQLRRTFHRANQQALTAIGYSLGRREPASRSGANPGVGQGAAAKRRRRVCPPGVAVPYVTARRAGQEYRELGAGLERDHAAIRELHRLGESAGLTPDYRWKINRVSASYRSAVADYREMRMAMLRQLGPELHYWRCKTEELLAQGENPELLDLPDSSDSGESPDADGGGPETAGGGRAGADRDDDDDDDDDDRGSFGDSAPVTFFIDNRACNVDFDLVLGGAYVGRVPRLQQVAFQSPVGPREMCLLVSPERPATGADDPDDGDSLAGIDQAAVVARCGSPGTVRTGYIHDGWSLVTDCQ